MLLKTNEFLFTDCQSTGASPANGNILEIAWCRANAMSDPQNIQSFVLKQPEDQPVPYIIQAITGIGEKELAEATEPLEAYRQFQKALQNPATVDDFAVIHYGRFEKAFLEQWHKTFAETASPLPFKILCTYEIAKRIFPNLPTRGINGLAGFFGATINDTKRSSCHVQATWLIWRELVNELAKLGIETTEQLEEWLSTVKAARRGKIEYPLDKTKRVKLPDQPGVYRMLDRAGNILYVGKATSLKSRVNSYFRGRAGKDARRLEMLTRAYDLEITECDTPLEAAILESDEIKRLNPPYNVALKTGRRQVIYYDRNLQLWSINRDEQYRIGPFSGTFHLEPLSRLSSSLKTLQFDPSIFLDYIDPQRLKEGYELFSINLSLPPVCKTPRQFMAFALARYKRLTKIFNAQRNEDGTSNEPAIELEVSRKPEQIQDFEADGIMEEPASHGQEFSPEGVAGKYERLLLRAAKAYLQAKTLCALANSFVQFEDGGIKKTLRVTNGLVSKGEADSLQCPGQFALAMDLVTFDRMRVLLAELGRVTTSGRPVRIQCTAAKPLPAWLLSRTQSGSSRRCAEAEN